METMRLSASPTCRSRSRAPPPLGWGRAKSGRIGRAPRVRKGPTARRSGIQIGLGVRLRSGKLPDGCSSSLTLLRGTAVSRRDLGSWRPLPDEDSARSLQLRSVRRLYAQGVCPFYFIQKQIRNCPLADNEPQLRFWPHRPGTPRITTLAAVLCAHVGVAIQAVISSGGVQIQSFHMP
jgi:hypothetical protein